MPVCLQHHISLPVKTQKACKMSLDSETVRKICPLNSIDLTQNNPVACGQCSALATFAHKHDTRDLMYQRQSGVACITKQFHKTLQVDMQYSKPCQLQTPILKVDFMCYGNE